MRATRRAARPPAASSPSKKSPLRLLSLLLSSLAFAADSPSVGRSRTPSRPRTGTRPSRPVRRPSRRRPRAPRRTSARPRLRAEGDQGVALLAGRPARGSAGPSSRRPSRSTRGAPTRASTSFSYYVNAPGHRRRRHGQGAGAGQDRSTASTPSAARIMSGYILAKEKKMAEAEGRVPARRRPQARTTPASTGASAAPRARGQEGRGEGLLPGGPPLDPALEGAKKDLERLGG